MSSDGIFVFDGEYCVGKSVAVEGIGFPSTRTRLGRLFVIGGNICAGKSTVAEALGSGEFVEPSAENNKWLTKFYDNPLRYGEVMQFYILRKRFGSLIKAFQRVEKGEDVYLDRAVWDDFVFVWKNWVDGNFSDEALETYKQFRKILIDDLQFPSAFVYLDVKVLECLRRNREQRRNGCESGLTEEYLSGLEVGYEIVREEVTEYGIPWIVLNWNQFGSPSVIETAVRDVPRYEETATWISKVNDPGWITGIMAKLTRLYEAAKKKAEDFVQPVEEKSVVLSPPSPIGC